MTTLIQRLPFLRHCSAVLASLSTGTPVFTEGAGCGKIGFVQSGTIRVFKLSETGREITLYRLESGESCILSMSCALSNPIHQASAVVEEDAEVLILSTGDFQQLIEKSHEARNYVFGQFASRLTDVMTVVEEVVFKRMDERLASLLAEFATTSANITKTHEELAVELGTAREVVSRTLKEFERQNLVRLGRGTITVHDKEALLRSIHR